MQNQSQYHPETVKEENTAGMLKLEFEAFEDDKSFFLKDIKEEPVDEHKPSYAICTDIDTTDTKILTQLPEIKSIKEECDDDEYKTVSNFQIQNYFTESNSDDTSSVIKDLKEEYADECEPVFDVLNQNEFPGTIIDDKLSIIKYECNFEENVENICAQVKLENDSVQDFVYNSKIDNENNDIKSIECLNSDSESYFEQKHFICAICNRSFSSKPILIIHLKNHSKSKRYTCHECGKSFSCKTSLNIHLRIHTKEKPYSCPMCDEDFSRKDYLNTHLKNHSKTHIQKKCFVCNICGVSFARNGNLISHKKIHTGEKPFKCKICKVAFARKHTLNKHFKRHTGERPYKCEVCDKSFPGTTNLKSHLKVHLK